MKNLVVGMVVTLGLAACTDDVGGGTGGGGGIQEPETTSAVTNGSGGGGCGRGPDVAAVCAFFEEHCPELLDGQNCLETGDHNRCEHPECADEYDALVACGRALLDGGDDDGWACEGRGAPGCQAEEDAYDACDAAAEQQTGSTGGGGDPSGQSSSGIGGGGDDACPNDPPYEPAVPPARPAGASPGDGAGVLLAVSRWYLGDTDRQGTPSPNAWKNYGYDVDGVNSVDAGGGAFEIDDLRCSCTPPGGEVSVPNLEDGPAGLDNAFGKSLVSFLGSVFVDMSEGATAGIEDGDRTIAFDLSTLGGAADYDPVATGLFQLRQREGGTWAYGEESLEDGDPGAPTTVFTTAYVNGDTWVSAPISSLDVPLTLEGVPFQLRIHDAVVTMALSADHLSTSSGVISGTLAIEELLVALAETLPRADDAEGLCPGDPLFESIAQNLRSAADIMADGTQAVGFSCNGMTIGLGFDAENALAEGVSELPDPGPSPCD